MVLQCDTFMSRVNNNSRDVSGEFELMWRVPHSSAAVRSDWLFCSANQPILKQDAQYTLEPKKNK